jgi:hypothetical protein
MCASKWSAITLISTAAALFAPVGASAQAGGGSPVTVVAIPVIGAEALSLTGTAPPSRPLEASIYVRISTDLPTVLLSRRIIVADASGRYAADMTHAPAFFSGAILTVVVQSLTTGAIARTEIPVVVPNVPAPPDALPKDYR